MKNFFCAVLVSLIFAGPALAERAEGKAALKVIKNGKILSAVTEGRDFYYSIAYGKNIRFACIVVRNFILIKRHLKLATTLSALESSIAVA
jgi:hypothetical protein